MLCFIIMSEAQPRQWVEANPGRVNDKDMDGYMAVLKRNLPMVQWLLDEKGADVNGRAWSGRVPLHQAETLDMLNALLDRGADPTLQNHGGMSPLMTQMYYVVFDNVERLLHDPRVQAIVNGQDYYGRTALYLACKHRDEASATSITRLLLQASANPILTNNDRESPLAYLREQILPTTPPSPFANKLWPMPRQPRYRQGPPSHRRR